MIGFALPIVWMNERKQVKIYKLIDRARNDAISISSPKSVSDGDNFKLVHTSGDTSTQEPV